MGRLVVLGDSIAFGQFVHPHKTWVHLLSEVSPVPIDNFSWCGDTTRLALERSLPLVQRDGCSYAYIQYGVNDANKWESDLGMPRVSPEAFRINLIEMVARCRKAGAQYVVLGTNHATTVDTEAYDLATGRVALSHGCRLVHNDGPTLDGVHLDEQGHKAYFDRIRTAFGW